MADGSDEHAMLLQISYDLNRLAKQGSSAEGVVDKSLTNMEKRAKKAAANLEEAFSLKGANLEGALGEVLQSSRLKVLDSGAAKVGVFGNALESLGPIGLTAAAGIGAVGLAIENNLKTAEWALQLTHASAALGLTTTQLQQFDLLANASGVPVDKMREGIAGLNEKLGALESGLVRGKQLTEFVSKLGFSPQQLRSWGTLQEQLPHVLDSLSKLNVQERAAAAQKLGIDPEVLNSLIEYRDKLGDVTNAGADFGVMSQAEVKHLADVAKQMSFTSGVINGNFRRAFLDLSPAILAAQGLLERFSNGLAQLAYNAKLTGSAIADMFRDAGSFLSGKGLPSDLLAGTRAIVAAHNAPEPKTAEGTGGRPGLVVTPHGPKGGAKADAAPGDLDQADKLLADAEKALATSFATRTQFEIAALNAEQAKANQKLADDLKRAKTAADRARIEQAQAETAQAYELKRQLATNQLADAELKQLNALDDIDVAGQEEQIRAQQALGATTARRAANALALFDLEEETVRAKQTEILALKTATDEEKAIAAARIASLDATEPARRQKVVNDNSIAISAQADEVRQNALQLQLDTLDAEKGVFQTTEKRREIALAIFSLEEKMREDKLREQIAEAQIAGDTEKAAQLRAQLANVQSTAGQREQGVSQANPGNSWAAYVQSAQQAAADVGEAFAKAKVDGIDAFNNSLFDAQGRFNKLGDIARNVGRSFITSFEKFSVNSIEAGLFGGQGGANGAGAGGNPFSALGGLFGGKAGGGGVGGLLGGLFGGKNKAPTGTSSDPIYVSFSAGGLGGGTGGAGGLSSLFGGGTGGSGGGGFLSSLFGGGSSGGAGGLLSGLSSIFHFASGGSFTVGGAGGVDKNLAVMRLTRGERVNVQTSQQQRDAQAGGIGAVTQNFNFPNASVDGFRRSSRQWARSARMGAQAAGMV